MRTEFKLGRLVEGDELEKITTYLKQHSINHHIIALSDGDQEIYIIIDDVDKLDKDQNGYFLNIPGKIGGYSFYNVECQVI